MAIHELWIAITVFYKVGKTARRKASDKMENNSRNYLHV